MLMSYDRWPSRTVELKITLTKKLLLAIGQCLPEISLICLIRLTLWSDMATRQIR